MLSLRSTNLMRLFNHKIPQSSTRGILLIEHSRFYGKYSGYGRRFGIWFNERTTCVVRACTKQLQYIFAQRIRRSLQLFQLYTRLWDELALKKFMKSWKRRLGHNTKEVLMGAVGVSMFDWNKERISDDELHRHSKEIQAIYKLLDSTLKCKVCHHRLIIDSPQPNIKYCTCNDATSKCAVVNNDSEWQPFAEWKDMLVWRREEPDANGLYAYKIFGIFSDVTAEEFLGVQTDVDYRKVWDSTAKELRIIDTDQESLSDEKHRTDVIYWEIIWPRLFSNRDYVYQRRWMFDEKNGVILIVSRVTDHPDAPIKPDTYRVNSYWSYMVIKPHTAFNEPGVEFGLTYFDDSGVNIPAAVTSWVAMNEMPDFLRRMRQAAKDYKQYINSKVEESNKLCDIEPELENQDTENALVINKMSDRDVEKNFNSIEIEIHSDNNNSSDVNLVSGCKEENKINSIASDENNNKDYTSDEEAAKQSGRLRYYFLTRLFA